MFFVALLAMVTAVPLLQPNNKFTFYPSEDLSNDMFKLEEIACKENLRWMKNIINESDYMISCNIRIDDDGTSSYSINMGEPKKVTDCSVAIKECLEFKSEQEIEEEEERQGIESAKQKPLEETIQHEEQSSIKENSTVKGEKFCDEKFSDSMAECQGNALNQVILNVGFSKVCIYAIDKPELGCIRGCVFISSPIGEKGDNRCGPDAKYDSANPNIPTILDKRDQGDEDCDGLIEPFCVPTIEQDDDIHTIFSYRIGQLKQNVIIGMECKIICYSQRCAISVQSDKINIKVELSTAVGKYQLTMNEVHEEGFLLASKIVNFPISGEGLYKLIVKCNGATEKRNIIITTKEFCDSKWPGLLNAFGNSYCKNYKTINVVTIMVLLLACMYFLSEFFAFIISMIISGLLFICSYMFFRKFYCQHCFKIKFKGEHVCDPLRCPYCDEEFIFLMNSSRSEKKREIDIHMKRCKSAKSDSIWYVCLKKNFNNMYKPFQFLFSKLPKLTLGLLCIIMLSFFVPAIAAESIEDKIASNLFKRIQLNRTALHEHSNDFFCSWITTISMASLFLITVIIYTVLTIRNYKKALFYLRIKDYDEGKDDFFLQSNIGTFCLDHGIRAHGIESLEEHSECLLVENYKKDGTLEAGMMKRKGAKYIKKLPEVARRIAIKRTKKKIYSAFIIFVIAINFQVAYCVDHLKEMEKVELDMVDYIKDLEKSGFHVFHGRFTGGARLKLAEIDEKKICDKVNCEIKMEMESDMVVRPGKEFGYRIKSEEVTKKDMFMNVKIINPKAECAYKDLYETGEVLHKSSTDDTCTESCGVCLNNIDNSLKNEMSSKKTTLHSTQHDDSSSWSCDGAGCMSIGSGCTCLKCWCELIKEKAYMIKKLVSEKHSFEFCMSLNNKGYCKTVFEEMRDEVTTVLEYSKSNKKCPEIIACSKSGVCLEGDINDIDQDFEKFGSVKKVNDMTFTIKNIEAEEICHFASHRYYVLKKCCHDTFHMLETLKPTGLLTKSDNVYEKTVLDLGSWKIRTKLPRLHYSIEVDKIKITSGKIVKCKGCYSCDEGASCVLEFKSNLAGILEIECDKCSVDNNHVQIYKGNNMTPFNVYCGSGSGNLTCKIGGFELKGSYRLLEEPRTPHGDGIINVDITKQVQHECDGFLCGFGLPSLDMFSKFKTTVIGIIVAVVAILLITLLIKFIKLFKN